MPRYSTEARYQVGEHWLSKQSRSPAWCRTWFDIETRQTRRVSLGTTDFDEAKSRLNEWFIVNQTRKKGTADQVTLAELFAPFYEKHASKTVSAYQARLAMRYWLEFFEEATVQAATEVPAQERFQDWLKTEKGVGSNTAARMISVGKTALNWAWKRGYLESVPYILPVKKQQAPPRGRPLSIEEIGKLIAHAKSQHIKDFIWLMVATAARPDAIYDLRVEQCDVEKRLIHLNPEGRQQTKKYRPTVKMPEEIVPRVEHLIANSQGGYLISYHGKKITSVKQAWRHLRAAAKLDKQVNPYSLRHTMARWLRAQSVPAWEVSAQLGHKQSGMSTTEIYAPFDPAYLGQSVTAIDVFLADLRVNCV